MFANIPLSVWFIVGAVIVLGSVYCAFLGVAAARGRRLGEDSFDRMMKKEGR